MLRKKHIDGAGTNENNATAHERIMEEVREGLLSSRMVVF
jgi:hypothetical protein